MLTNTVIEKNDPREELSAFLDNNRNMLAPLLIDTAKIIPRFHKEISALGNNTDQFIKEQLECNIDYVKHWLCDNDQNFSALYVGEKAKIAFESQSSADKRNKTIVSLIESDRKILLDAIKENCSEDAQKHINTFYQELINSLNQPVEKTLKILFIGDCLYLDIVGFLTGQVAKHRTAIVPEFLTHKNPHKTQEELKKYNSSDFDLIFYSPFTYAFNQDFTQFLNWRNATLRNHQISNIVNRIFDDITPIIDILAANFSASVFIHNTSAILRAENTGKHTVKNHLTRRIRNKAKALINDKIDLALKEANANNYLHLYVFDEAKYLETMSDTQLGEFFYRSKLQHPAKLGAVTSKDYDFICETTAYLAGKKIIVCDLDNTLWDGVIGEGKVKHHTKKQQLLKRIKSKGIVLAIASKNDPANIHWDGGVLDDDDFVYRHINWNPKIGAFSKMQKELNLKLKDFIFIDDRADEREFVKSTYPEITTLCALDDRSWDMITLWEKMLDENGAMDRTQLYQERAQRNSFLSDTKDNAPSEAEMFSALALNITVADAGKADIKRATELINRTNQFNMCASRTSEQEMTERFNSDKYTILTSSMADKFGDMGIISILVAQETDTHIEIIAFVLSCRVFGYAAESVILNKIKQLAKSKNKPIKGQYIETMHNGPCKNTYQENNFAMVEDFWEYDDLTSEIQQPSWFTIK